MCLILVWEAVGRDTILLGANWCCSVSFEIRKRMQYLHMLLNGDSNSRQCTVPPCLHACLRASEVRTTKLMV